jgi:dinuclear metal center YbgI/SA1388 family protein
MAKRDTVLAHLDEVLDASSFGDYGPNGLQVPGTAEITTVATGVSAGLELFERAAAEGAELVLVHHGLFWGGQPQALTPTMARRLKTLLTHDMNLAAYHLPLDAHAWLGNNALLADALGVTDRGPLGEAKGRAIGLQGSFAGEGLAPDELVERIRAATGSEPLVFADGPDRVRTIGIVTGGAARLVSEAIALGLDAFVTGEPTESVMTEVREARIHFVAAGHYATETFGVKALGELLAERFELRHVFIDVPNPV